MLKTFHSTIESTLNLFPEVRWDRWSGEIDNMGIFGWISRPDGKFDFVQLIFVDGEAEAISTSSKKYSEDFGKRLGFENHRPCKRVEKDFPGVNSIKLKPKEEKPQFPTDGSINPAYHDLSVANEGINPYE